jgi:hypothetical protein
VTSGLLSKAKRKNYLYVEGSDDKNVFIHLLNHHGITTPDLSQRGYFKGRDEHFEIKDCDGINNLLDAFKVALKSDADNKRYAVVVDADTGNIANWQKLRKIVGDFGYSDVPLVPDGNGVIIKQEGLPGVGIWLMPNNKLPGAIEDFVSFLGPHDDELWPIAEAALRQAKSVKCNFRQSYTMKAHLYTWLAWQKEPGIPMGLAITKNM